jgi:3-isopropylmalate dehydrogenase
MLRLAVIPGAGIGPEVIAERLKVLEAVGRVAGIDLALAPFDYGAERYLRTGETLPPGAIEEFRDHSPPPDVPCRSVHPHPGSS